MSLGHESSGVVQAVGSASTTQQNGVIGTQAQRVPISSKEICSLTSTSAYLKMCP